MGFQKELKAHFGSGRRNNIGFTLNAGGTMILNFKVTGTDTATNKYFNLRNEAMKVQIRNNVLATITEINGVALKTPITLGTATSNVWSSGIEWSSIKVEADQDDTSFEVYAS